MPLCSQQLFSSVMVCVYAPAGVPAGIPRPKYIGLLVDGDARLGAGIVMPVNVRELVRALPVYVVCVEASYRVLPTPNVVVPDQSVPSTSTLAAALPFKSVSVTSTFVGTLAFGAIEPNAIEFGVSDM